MPKKIKIKKPITRKTKNKNVVNVKINIDNSKKTTARRTPVKPSNMQPFVNFPSHQPARIQFLEPKSKYESPDFTKTMDEYQKQFKTYLETTDKNVKDMIEKYDDTLKKNTAPPKKEESKPGASNVYATDEGETVFEEPISLTKNIAPQKKEEEPILEESKPFKKRQVIFSNDNNNFNVGFSGWGRSNELQGNNMTSIKPTQLQQNQLPQVPIVQAEEKKIEIVEGIPLTEEELRQLTEEELKQLLSNSSDAQIRAILEKSPPQTRTMVRKILDEMKSGDSLDEIYNEYVKAHIQYYSDDEYLTKNAWNGKGGAIDAKQWGRKRSDITDLIKKYGTFEEENRQKEKKYNKTKRRRREKKNRKSRTRKKKSRKRRKG